MTFGEHLEELRSRLIISLVAFAVAFVVALFFQDRLMWFFTRPYERARADVNAKLRAEWVVRKHSVPPTDRVDSLIDVLERHFSLPPEELQSLRSQSLTERTPPPQLDQLQAIGLGEPFSAYMRVCLLAAALVSAPILLTQIWSFVAAGLYRHERRVVGRVLPFSLLLFFLGFAFGYFVLAELSVRFLVSYGDLEYVRPQIAIGPYFGVLFLLLLVMGLVFQVPLIMTVVASIGLVQPGTFRKYRRHSILAIFIIAAVITPPDYISQLLVAAPMLLLFELGIFLAAAAAKKRAAEKLEPPAAPSAPPTS